MLRVKLPKKGTYHKELYFECPNCHGEEHVSVVAYITKSRGLEPTCRKCGTSLIRRVKKVAD